MASPDDLLQLLVAFFSNPLFVIISGSSTLLVVVGFLFGLVSVVLGEVRPWWRLGTSLSHRKIGILSNDFPSLSDILVDSGLFNRSRIKQIHGNAFERVADYSLILLDYTSCSGQLESLLDKMQSGAAVIVYAPPTEDGTPRISPEHMRKIHAKMNATVVNMRGRLLNDILTSMITTGFAKRSNS